MNRYKHGLRLLFKNPRRFAGRFLGPRILVTSVPKSGTNLLVHTLSLFPQLSFDGTTVRLPDKEQYSLINGIRRGCIVSTHKCLNAEMDRILNQKEIKVLYIIRDPRDVCVSLHYWIKNTDYHYFHSTYNTFASEHERLMKIITGFEPKKFDRNKKGIVSIDYHFRRSLSWMNDQRCRTIRFEDLIGPRGGGRMESQLEVITAIAGFLNIHLSKKDIQIIRNNIFSDRTATFRKGQIGSWRHEFSKEHISNFKKVAGQLLIDLEYEKDFNW